MTRMSLKKARALGIIPGPEQQKQPAKEKPKGNLKERDIQRQIKEYLQWHGWLVVKIHQSLGSYKGIADLYALKNGRSVWIEVKTPKGKQSKDQEQFEKDIKAHGGEYMVARSVEDVMGLEG
ncbi:MAG: VRR-NUC domain-containing protein [Desulfotomaculum sp.]|nr:VRR-NUC domain-containing protein [Desulfotomaculum sp.]